MVADKSEQPATTVKTVTKPMKTFYRRELKKPCVAFSSVDGRQVFREALIDGTMECFFRLAEQFRTQDEVSFCGLSTLTMVLNALAVDPGRVWKGPWRWYHESMLDCCSPLDVVMDKGITISTLACLARCNGLSVELNRTDAHTIDELRAVIEECSREDNGKVVVVSYDRRELNQTGSGHFSPIGGFHKSKDLVLIMDTARFKLPPHWAPLSDLWKAMRKVDPDTGRPRGYLVLEKAHSLSHRLVTSIPNKSEVATWVNEMIDLVIPVQGEDEHQRKHDSTLPSADATHADHWRALREATTVTEFVHPLLKLLPTEVRSPLTSFSAKEQASGKAQDQALLQAIQTTEAFREVTKIQRVNEGSCHGSPSGGSDVVELQLEAQARPSSPSTSPSLPSPPPPSSSLEETLSCRCTSRHVMSIMTYAMLLLLHMRDDHGDGGADAGRGDRPAPLWREDPLHLLPEPVATEAKYVAGMLMGLAELECPKCKPP